MKNRVLTLQMSSFIMGLIVILSFATVYSLLNSFKWVSHTHEVIHQVRHIRDDVLDCQTSLRETVFSADKKYINLYLSKSPLIDGDLDKLQWLTRDNEKQQSNIYELKQNIGRRFASFHETLDLFYAGKFEEAKLLQLQRFGEPWVTSTRNLVEIIESEEIRLLEIRLLDYQYKSNIVLYGMPLLMIVYIVLFNVTTASIKNELGV